MIVGLRDALLLTATVIGMRDLWRSTVTGRWTARTGQVTVVCHRTRR
jgi:hypothetical protein